MFGLSIALVAPCLSVAPGAQAPSRSIAGVLDTLDRVRAIHETAISPDGRRVAWVEDVSVAEGTMAIYMRTMEAGRTPQAGPDPAGPPAGGTAAIAPQERSGADGGPLAPGYGLPATGYRLLGLPDESVRRSSAGFCPSLPPMRYQTHDGVFQEIGGGD